MPKKNEPYLTIEHFENELHLNDVRELIYYMRGYFNELAFNYKKMKMTQIKSELEDLKVVFEFFDKMKKKRGL
jgi:translation elongation factor EF-4